MEVDDVPYLVQCIKDAEKLSLEDSRKLLDLKVTLKHDPLPQHEIETRAGSRPPLRTEIEQFEQIITIKKGPYSPKEDDFIVHNWKSFCKLHNWDKTNAKPFLHLREGNVSYIRSKIQRRRFVQYLANGLPNRTLYSVYHRFRTLYGDNVQRRYDPEEDELILHHIANNINHNDKRKYADLAKVLKRTRGSVWRRYRILKRKWKQENGLM